MICTLARKNDMLSADGRPRHQQLIITFSAGVLIIVFLLFICGGIPDEVWAVLSHVRTKAREAVAALVAAAIVFLARKVPGYIESRFLGRPRSASYATLLTSIVSFVAITIAATDTWNIKQPNDYWQSEHHQTFTPPPQLSSTPISTVVSSSTKTLHIGPDNLYPDATKTPGEAATLDGVELRKDWIEGCPGKKLKCTYSQAHRKVSNAERIAVYDTYKVPTLKRKIAFGEVDHFYPLCAGGSNDVKNLWYQRINGKWKGYNFGYKEKDKLESYICRQIKANKMTPQEAFDRMTSDWVKFYIDELSDDDDLKEQEADDEGGGS
jgi:hypothetical protein